MNKVTLQNHHLKTIRELMGMEPEYFGLPRDVIGKPPPEMQQEPETAPTPPFVSLPAAEVAPDNTSSLPQATIELEIREFGSPFSRFFSHNLVRYPLIFLLALGFFYGILNFRAIFQQVSGFFSLFKNSEKVLSKQAEQVAPQYSQWLKKHYVYVNDQTILKPENDPDEDGLINFYEFYFGTNPLKADTDEDRYDDGREILNGYNPLYEGKLLAWQQKVISEKIDLENLKSRRNLREFQSRVAGEQNASIDGFWVDPTKPGNISVPKLGINAPIIWTREFGKMEDDLKSGAAHHPATPYPGQQGTSSIHGHSSGNPWDGSFKTLFTKLNFLEPGDEVFVTVYNASGQSQRYLYVVRSKKIYAKTDPEQFADLGGHFLNLSTSWPVGTARQRYVVTTELVGL